MKAPSQIVCKVTVLDASQGVCWDKTEDSDIASPNGVLGAEKASLGSQVIGHPSALGLVGSRAIPKNSGVWGWLKML